MPTDSSMHEPDPSGSRGSRSSFKTLRAKDYGKLDHGAANFTAWRFQTELTISSTDGYRTILDSDDEDSVDDERQLSLLALLSQIVRDKSGASGIM